MIVEVLPNSEKQAEFSLSRERAPQGTYLSADQPAARKCWPLPAAATAGRLQRGTEAARVSEAPERAAEPGWGEPNCFPPAGWGGVTNQVYLRGN